MLLESIWRLDAEIIDRTDQLLPIITALTQLPGFAPRRYDFNQHGSWRAFDPELACVDGLSQRVQLLRIESEDPTHFALITMGKNGDAPTALCALPEQPWRTIVDQWPSLLRDTITSRAMLTSASWRSQIITACSDPRASAIGIANAFSPDQFPAAWRDLDLPQASHKATDDAQIWCLGDVDLQRLSPSERSSLLALADAM